MPIKVLVIDDEEDILNLLQESLVEMGYYVRVASNRYTALKLLEQEKPDIVLLDVWLDNSDKEGLDLLKEIKESREDLNVLMISGHGGVKAAVESIKMGAYDYIEKPFNEDRIDISIRRAFEALSFKKKTHYLEKNNNSQIELIGKSSHILQLKEIAKASSTIAKNILIYGKAGVGKSLLSKYIHNLSFDSNSKFVLINLIHQKKISCHMDLFEFVKSEFCGKIEGTIFLKNISDFDICFQREIMLFLRTIKESGDLVKVIASLSEDKNICLNEKRLNEDLYYMLNDIPIKMLPLDDHIEDIDDLCDNFISLFSAFTKTKKVLSKEIKDLLKTYSWPGSVRQLKNIVEWMIIVSPNDQVEINTKNISKESIDYFMRNNAQKSCFSEDFLLKPIKEARNIFEKVYFTHHYNRFDFSVSKTASFVGMERSALYRKLKSLDIIK